MLHIKLTINTNMSLIFSVYHKLQIVKCICCYYLSSCVDACSSVYWHSTATSNTHSQTAVKTLQHLISSLCVFPRISMNVISLHFCTCKICISY